MRGQSECRITVQNQQHTSWNGRNRMYNFNLILLNLISFNHDLTGLRLDQPHAWWMYLYVYKSGNKRYLCSVWNIHYCHLFMFFLTWHMYGFLPLYQQHEVFFLIEEFLTYVILCGFSKCIGMSLAIKKNLLTDVTFVWVFSFMHQYVLFEVSSPCKLFLADFKFVRILSGLCVSICVSLCINMWPLRQSWLRHCTNDQKIMGSNPGWIWHGGGLGQVHFHCPFIPKK